MLLDAPIPGKRRRGRQTTRWKYLCKTDSESVGLFCIEFGVVRIDSAIVVCIHSAIIQLLLKV